MTYDDGLFIDNTLLIPAAAAGVLDPVAGILMRPIVAGGAMALSSVSAVSNSLRRRRFRALDRSRREDPMKGERPLSRRPCREGGGA